jgi:lysozyme
MPEESSMVTVPKNAIDLAMCFEGFFAKAYICPAGFATQGFGHLVQSLSVPPITREQGEIWLAQDLQDALHGTIRTCPILVTVPETWLGAIVDFVFNLGAGRLQTSTLRRKINGALWNDVSAELNKWVYGGGRKLKGLVARRQMEGLYFR